MGRSRSDKISSHLWVRAIPKFVVAGSVDANLLRYNRANPTKEMKRPVTRLNAKPCKRVSIRFRLLSGYWLLCHECYMQPSPCSTVDSRSSLYSKLIETP